MMRTTGFIFVAAVLLAIQGNAALAETQAGISAAVRGDIDLSPVSGQAKHQPVGGEGIFLGDAISSHDDAGMQLILLDETVFTIGANTDLTVDEFVYDPVTGAGEVVASLTKGVFRFVTGNIAQGDPEDMKIILPGGTIGIRGTIGAASYLNGVAAVVLLGPGPDNNADARQGHLEVTAQGVTINLTRPGYGTIIEPGQAPSVPVLFSDVQIGIILNSLAPPPLFEKPLDAPTGEMATKLSNEEFAQATETSGGFLPPPQDSPEDQNGFNATTSDPLLGTTTFEQLRAIQTGTGLYQFNGPFTQTLKAGAPAFFPGVFSGQLTIDFGTRRTCVAGCSININTVGSGGNIADVTGFNTFNYGNINKTFATDIFLFANPKFGGSFGSLINTDGLIANRAFVSVKYNFAGNAGHGAGNSAPRK